MVGTLLGALGLGSRFSRVVVDRATVEVRMGWAFCGAVPLAAVSRATRGRDVALTRGVHGWRGDWLVNGSGRGVVELGLEPPLRARVAGVPVRVRRLRVSVEDVDGLLDALA